MIVSRKWGPHTDNNIEDMKFMISFLYAELQSSLKYVIVISQDKIGLYFRVNLYLCDIKWIVFILDTIHF